ncbi:thioredoxin family protein [Chloroflexota bacterium]
MKIKILGPGCVRCDQVEKTTKEVVEELGIDTSLEHVRDVKKIMEYPILHTPGLVLNEEVVCFGRVPTKADITQFITVALAKEEKAEK